MAIATKFHAFSFDQEAQRNFPVRLRHACRFRSSDRTLSEAMSFPCWVLDCPWSYCGHTLAGGSWRRRDRGRMHLYAPHTEWIEDNRDAGPHQSCYLCFDGGELLGLTRLTGASGFAALRDDQLRAGRMISSLAAQGMRSGNHGLLEALGRLYLLAAYLTTHARPDAGGWILEPAEHAAATLARRLRRYFEGHYREALTLDMAAAAMGMSRSSLSHRYRAETGASVMAALTALRLEKSVPLLLRRLPLKQVAAAVGISDPFHYSKLFRKTYGLSPKQYRRR